MGIKERDGWGGKYSERRVSLDQIIHTFPSRLQVLISLPSKEGEKRLKKRVERQGRGRLRN